MLEYEYGGQTTTGKLYVSSSDKYNVGDVMDVRINPDDPTKIADGSFNKYVVPFLVVVFIFDFLYIKNKLSS